MRLTDRQRDALIHLRRCAARDDGWGVICTASGEDGIYDGQAFVNWRTAQVLERRGAVECDWKRKRLRLVKHER